LEALLLARRIPFPPIEFISLGLGGLRDRLDFTLEDGRLGLYGKDRLAIADLDVCLQLGPPLQSWLTEFRSNLPPVAKMSVRLRVSPKGERGMWLDFANVEIKNLLDDQTWLRSWDDGVHIEIGQKRKGLDRSGERLKLKDPFLFPWFQTKYADLNVPLYGCIGSFTQPSLFANQHIGKWIAERVSQVSPAKILEFGTGQGNLSFPVLGASNAELVACDNDGLALEGFQQSLEHLALVDGVDLRPRVKIQTGDFRRRPSADLADADFLLANPARSGLGSFLDPLTMNSGLASILMMSCHPESFTEDAAKFVEKGFRLKDLSILDQFPQTKHYEVLSWWMRN
jgi:23S rRNA (uracil1939-C5)-methyltransferase